jgi:hypothetical protein
LPSVKMPKSRLRRKLKLLAGSGIIDMNFSELKRARHKREKKHKNLQKIEQKCRNSTPSL